MCGTVSINGWEGLFQFEWLSSRGSQSPSKNVMLWFVCVGTIWDAKNEITFQNEEITIVKMVKEAKILSWKILFKQHVE